MASESKGTTVKKVMTQKEAEQELRAHITELAEMIQLLYGEKYYDKIGDLVWVSKTGQKHKLRDMDQGHILASIRTLTTREVTDVLVGKNPGFTVKSMAIVSLKMELARRYTNLILDKKTIGQSVNKWQIDQIKEMITEIALPDGIK